MNIGMDTKITDMITDNKKPFIHKGRKVFFRGTTLIFDLRIQAVDLRGLEPLTFSMP
jgi:hypothetical protein